jgi:hypothetical protein
MLVLSELGVKSMACFREGPCSTVSSLRRKEDRNHLYLPFMKNPIPRVV